MPKIKPSVMLAALAVVGLAVWAGAQIDTSGSTMARAAGRFLEALDDAQKQKATFAFDDAERLNWHFIPRARNGLPIKEMNGEQRALAFGLVQSGLSRSGGLKATTIMSLEAILRDLEKGSGPTRDPELYYVSIFGKPSDRGEWGWRVEGHHLSLNFTLKDGQVVAATPAFFGANPAEVRQGPREGLRTLAEIEDRAIRLFQALTDDQKKVALASEKAPADVPSNTGGQGGLPPKPPEMEAVGIAAGELTPDQRQMLVALIESYALDMPEPIAKVWMGEAREAGDRLRFAWYGPVDRNQPHGYLIQGGVVDIEFNNTQNNANHIHSVWRNTLGDFGRAGAN